MNERLDGISLNVEEVIDRFNKGTTSNIRNTVVYKF